MSIDISRTAPSDLVVPHQERPEIHELRASVMGTVHVPGEPGWDAARLAWAVHVAQQPLAVVEVADADDVRRTVQWAVRHGHQVTAQPVGHGASRALAENRMDRVVVLRTRAMDDIDDRHREGHRHRRRRRQGRRAARRSRRDRPDLPRRRAAPTPPSSG